MKKYVAPAIIAIESAQKALGTRKSTRFDLAKGNGTPDSLQINSSSAYEANS